MGSRKAALKLGEAGESVVTDVSRIISRPIFISQALGLYGLIVALLMNSTAAKGESMPFPSCFSLFIYHLGKLSFGTQSLF